MRSRKVPSSLASAACIVVSNWLSWASSAASLVSTKALTSSTWFGASASHRNSAAGRWWGRPCSGKKWGSPAARLALLLAAAGDERGEVGADVPRPLRAVGADEVVDDAAGRRPLGERPSRTELDVVGMGADRQRRARDVVVARPRRRQRRLSRLVRSHVGRWARRAGWAKSAGVSTS